MEYLIIGGIVSIVVLRFIGAWMLRIDDVIKELREIKEIMEKQVRNKA